MSQPSPYARDYDFEGFQSGHPSTPLPGDKLNAELDAVDTAIDAILTNLALIQRDDTAVANKSIGWDQLKDELRHGFTTPTEWATGTAYEAGDQVYFGRKVYAAKVGHTSGTFSIDYNAGDWLLLADFTPITEVDQSAQESATDAANSAAEAATSAATATTKATAASTSETNAAASAAAAAADAAELAVWSATYDPADKAAQVVVETDADASTFGFVVDEDDMASDSATKLPTQQSVNQGKLQKVATRTALKALSGTTHPAVYLYEDGREGIFKWDSSDLSTEVTADTEEGIYVAPSSDTTGASGAWVRQGGWAVAGADARWFGLVADYDPDTKTGTAADDAINAALAVVPWVRLPAGNILLSDMVTLDGTSDGKKMTGAGRRSTFVYVNSDFNLTADGVINFAGGEAKHELGHFSVFCQDQPDSATLADYVAYPPVVYANAQPRFKIESMRIQEAYVGIDMRGNSGGAVIDDLELCSFYRGIRIDGSLDSVKISRFHFWPFNFSTVTNKRSVYHDSRGIELGRADDFHLTDALIFGCRYGLYAGLGSDGNSSFGTLNSVDFDASGGLYIDNGQLFASSCVFTLSDTASQLIYIGNGKLTVSSSYFLVSAVTTLGGSIDVLNGTALFSGCWFYGGAKDNYIIRVANTAIFGVSGSYFYRDAATTFTKEAIIASGTGVTCNVTGNFTNEMTTGSSKFLSVGSTTIGGEVGNHLGTGWSNTVNSTNTAFRSDRRRTYTPTVTAGSGALTSVTGQSGDWSQVGDTVYFRSRATITTNGTGATALKFTLPKNNAASAGCPVSAINSTDGKALAAVIGSGTNVITVTNVDGTYPGADGKTIIISGSYQVA